MVKCHQLIAENRILPSQINLGCTVRFLNITIVLNITLQNTPTTIIDALLYNLFYLLTIFIKPNNFSIY